MSIVDLTGHPEIGATFHFPCHYCGQSIEVVDTVRQPHECRTYETDAERICAAYWAGYERAREAETSNAENDARREADVLIEAGHPSRPDREELMRQHVERIKARAWDQGYTSGHSNAMRRMSDEPDAPTTRNPYRTTPEASHE